MIPALLLAAVGRTPPPGRDEARDAALRELADPIYSADDPSWLDIAWQWLLQRLGELLEAAAANSPGGYFGLLVLAAVVVLAVIAIRLRLGRVRRGTTVRSGLFGARELTADEHRRAADGHAARGEWADAVRERLRGLVRGLEERDLIESGAGRTAGEVAVEAGRVLPALAAELSAAARTFDEVSYGGRPAGPETDARLRELDGSVRRARPGVPAPTR
jgi:hypothetical protein